MKSRFIAHLAAVSLLTPTLSHAGNLKTKLAYMRDGQITAYGGSVLYQAVNSAFFSTLLAFLLVAGLVLLVSHLNRAALSCFAASAGGYFAQFLSTQVESRLDLLLWITVPLVGIALFYKLLSAFLKNSREKKDNRMNNEKRERSNMKVRGVNSEHSGSFGITSSYAPTSDPKSTTLPLSKGWR